MTPQHWIQMQKSVELVMSNPDLMTRILVCLPVKPLLRCKSVSKPWLHLISSTDFAKTYTLTNPTPSVSAVLATHHITREWKRKYDLFITYHSLDNSYRPSFGPVLISDFLRITPDAKNITIISSSNGLLLLSCSSFMEENLNNACKNEYYLVSNPTTKRISAPLLSPLEIKTSRHLEIMAFAFDPTEELSVHYKVVCVWSYDFKNFGIKIYSSETGSWRTCPGTCAFPYRVPFEKGVYWKGNMHYINELNGHDSVYFSLGQDQTLKSLSMPPLQRRGEFVSEPIHRDWFLGQSGGHLWLVENHAYVLTDVYNLKTDYSGWEMLYQIRLPEIGPSVMEFEPEILSGRHWGYALSVVMVRKENDEHVFEIVCMLRGALVAYDPKSHTARLLQDLKYEGVPGPRGIVRSYNVENWIETLAPV